MDLRGKFILKSSSLCRFTRSIAIIFIFFITNKGFAQSQTVPVVKQGSLADTSGKGKDSIKVKMNGGSIALDTVKKDSLAIAADTSKIKNLERGRP